MRDVFNGNEIVRFDSGRAPQGLALSPNGRTLYVHNFMDRTVTVHDLSAVLSAPGAPIPLLNTYSCITSEQLAPVILVGKQLFYDASDTRLALQGYISCAACHNDGGHDGRVWDFTGFGEGLRNTIDLRGHAGIAQGPLHWSGNFDEVQDFEGQIRSLAFGGGLMSNSDFLAGTHAQPLGDPKAGLSAELDALAAYVASLNSHPRSPFRAADGSRSAAANSGQSLFLASDCDGCHTGPHFTDSALNNLHDIGTLTPASGTRLGGVLPGLDTPTLRGVWAGAPYLHDGTALTLPAAIQAHSGTVLAPAQMDMLVSYLEQLDDLEPVPMDSDGDGLADELEVLLGTNPLLADSDGDTLSDYYEVNIDSDPGSYQSGMDYDPLLADSDADGFADAVDAMALVFNFADGDVAPLGAPDGAVNAGDLVIYLRMITGDLIPSTLELAHGDLYPVSAPDGVIDLSDFLILRQVLP
jgi:mono/diheme cytochrome c family protein